MVEQSRRDHRPDCKNIKKQPKRPATPPPATTPAMLRPLVKTLMVVMAIALWSDWTAAASGAAKTVVEKMDATVVLAQPE
jgi:hypothetical protein